MADEKGDSVNEVNHDDSTSSEHDPHFEPIITLPEVNVSTLEEDEVEMLKMRAKLFRYDTSESPAEWKERGTGDVKILRHTEKNCVRVVMRRDRTLKICANHYGTRGIQEAIVKYLKEGCNMLALKFRTITITPWMELKPNCGSDRAWVYSVPADFADEEVRSELLAIKFATAENAKKWKEIFEEAKTIVETQCELYAKKAKSKEEDEEDDEKEESEEESKDAEDVVQSLEKLKVDDEKKVPENARSEDEKKIPEDTRNGDDKKEASD